MPSAFARYYQSTRSVQSTRQHDRGTVRAQSTVNHTTNRQHRFSSRETLFRGRSLKSATKDRGAKLLLSRCLFRVEQPLSAFCTQPPSSIVVSHPFITRSAYSGCLFTYSLTRGHTISTFRFRSRRPKKSILRQGRRQALPAQFFSDFRVDQLQEYFRRDCTQGTQLRRRARFQIDRSLLLAERAAYSEKVPTCAFSNFGTDSDDKRNCQPP